MRAPLLWAGGIAGSLLAHVAAFSFLNLSVQPDPTPTQPKPETKLAMDAYQVDRQKAEEKTADSEAAQEQEAEGQGLNAGAIPQSKAEATAPDSNNVEAQRPVSALTEPVSAKTDTMQATSHQTTTVQPSTAPTPQALVAAKAPSQSVAPSQSTAEKVETSQARAEPLKASTVAPVSLASATVTATSAVSINASPAVANNVRPDTQAALQAAAPTLAMLQLEAPSDDAPQAIPDAPTANAQQATGEIAETLPAPSEAANQPELPSTFAKADTAWNFGDRIVTDPTALATIQAFMSPEALSNSASNAGRARDGLESLLTSIDCARLSATFIPETGALELRGHVPDNALRGPILQTLQDQIGEGITVTDNLRHLPKPQCGALTGIADVGLPQSTDQLTNKRLIGDNAQAVEYTYSEGQALGFDMTAPDYAAVVYVDYFDAAGQVIHLVPNEVVPLTRYTPAQVVGIERGEGPRLNITIGPPFGQEIAVAFAASKPLYDGTRPIIEPAEPYLEFLKAKVSEARETDPDFKGEWVYFFITTQPATQ